MTLTFARKDLVVLWASPIPYLSLALFQLSVGFLYTDQLAGRRQAVFQPLTPIAGFLLLIVVPVLGMRAVAEEARLGTLDLLLAVPISIGRFVIGKWLAVTVTAWAVLAPAVMFAVLLRWWGHPDPGPIVSSFVGLAALTAGVAAIAVLASSLTTSQPVAAVLALSVSLLLWFSHRGPEVFGSGGVLAWLSLSDRLQAFASGTIDTADVAFFAVVAGACLLAAAVAIDARRVR